MSVLVRILGTIHLLQPLITRRVQMSEDEVRIHFFQFDETGNEGFFIRDLRRLAAAHDFTWYEKDMAYMMHLFDSDGDGKVQRRLVEFMLAAFHRSPHSIALLKKPVVNMFGEAYDNRKGQFKM